jgi:thymidylate synthase (FAD)
MKLIKPSFQIIEPTGYAIDNIYKSIELAGRVSHKSEDKITETSAKDFVGRMLNMKHLATCEFGTVYLYIDCYSPNFITILNKYICNNYSECIVDAEFPSGNAYISTNYRVLVENNWLDDLKYLREPTKYHHKRYTVKFVLDRAISHKEFVA